MSDAQLGTDTAIEVAADPRYEQAWAKLREVVAELGRREGRPEDDLCQEVLLVVRKRLSGFDRQQPGSLRGWLGGIWRNLRRNLDRGRRRKLGDFGAGGTDPGEVLGQQPDGESRSPLTKLADRAEYDRACREVGAMSAAAPDKALWYAVFLLDIRGDIEPARGRAALGFTAVKYPQQKAKFLAELQERMGSGSTPAPGETP